MEPVMDEHEKTALTSRQGDAIMWICVALALVVALTLVFLAD